MQSFQMQQPFDGWVGVCELGSSVQLEREARQKIVAPFHTWPAVETLDKRKRDLEPGTLSIQRPN